MARAFDECGIPNAPIGLADGFDPKKPYQRRASAR
jgi:hypothetical protein